MSKKPRKSRKKKTPARKGNRRPSRTPRPTPPGPIIDINCDMGERAGTGGVAADVRLMQFVSSVNICCGAHAGSPDVMYAVMEAARDRRLRIGAHPGYPDPENFGRVSRRMWLPDLRQSLYQQLLAFTNLAKQLGCRVAYVKPHGALYHDIHKWDDVAETFTSAVRDVFRRRPMLMGLANSGRRLRWKSEGWRVIEEAFAERAYRADGSLIPRGEPDAVIHDPLLAAKQAANIARNHRVDTQDGPIPLLADTICIHSDSPNAESVAQAVHAALLMP